MTIARRPTKRCHTSLEGTTKYVTGPDGLPLEQVSSGGTVLYYYEDQLGSTRGLADASGNTAATYVYDAYGNLKSSTGSVSNPFQYAGQYTDSESGLQYLRARYYDASTQQFLTVDPLVGQTQQAYTYILGNPLNGVAPYGLDCSLFGGSLPFGSGGTCNGQAGNAIGHGLGQVGNGAGSLSGQVFASATGLTAAYDTPANGYAQFMANAPGICTSGLSDVLAAGLFLFAPGIGGVEDGVLVIGKLADLSPDALREGETTLLPFMRTQLESPKAYWARSYEQCVRR